MKPNRWNRIEELFHAARERPPDERSGFLAEACADDEELRYEIDTLLEEYERGGSSVEYIAPEFAAEWAEEQRSIPTTLGHFRILSRLGKGGMGEVFLAEDARLRRKVALKLLPKEFASDREWLRRFEQEARAASALNHPNIVTIYDIDRTGDTPFIAAEFVDGGTLKSWAQAETRTWRQ